MKKILALVSVIVIVFTFSSCEKDKKVYSIVAEEQSTETTQKLSGNNNKYEGYALVSDLKKVDYASTEILVRVDGALYGKSYGVIDYAGGTEKVGTIDKVIDIRYVPKYDNETNCEDIGNAEVYYCSDENIVLFYNDDYVLFNRINDSKQAKSSDERIPSYADYFTDKICIVKEINGTVLSLAEYDTKTNREIKVFHSADYCSLENADELSFAKGDIVKVRYRVIENTYSTDTILYSIETFLSD